MSTAIETPAAASNNLAHNDSPNVPIQTRSERLRSYDPADFGMPTGLEVNFKHSPVSRLQVVLTDEETENIDTPGVSYDLTNVEKYLVESVGLEAPVRGEFFVPEDRISANAWKNSPRAVHVRFAANEEVSLPLFMSITGNGVDRHANAHIIIEAMPNSHATIVLDHRGTAQYAQNVEIIVRDGASLSVISVQRWEHDAVHASAHQARVDKDATLKHVVASFSGGVVRVNSNVELAGNGSACNVFGVSFADQGEHLESQVYMFHKGGYTKGDVLYKSALQGQSARTVWIGDVQIGPDAVGTDSYEANRNLVLTQGARADSIPNLEIQTGDIAGAGHASATGRFDDEQLFYLQARGIDEDEARRLVVVGFLGEIVQKIGIESLEDELFEAIQVELTQGAIA